MSLSISLARALVRLVQEKSLNASEIKNKKQLKELIEYGIISIQYKGQRAKISLLSIDKLHLLLQKVYGITNLQAYLKEFDNHDKTRASISKVTSDSKTFKTNVQAGLYLASYDNVQIRINKKPLSLYTPHMSTFFIHINAELEIDKDVLIIGVENFENLSSIELQKKLFDEKRKKLFIWRNKFMLDFIARCENDYLHFGDFDLAGIHIYLNEIVPRVEAKKHSFFIPKKISVLLEKGNSEDYFIHSKKYPKLSSDKQYLQELIELIHKNKRSLHQEYLIDD